MKLSEELKKRGFVNQFSGESLEQILDGEKRTVYLGTDPSAPSLTIGNLAVQMLMRHIADAGHKVILLVGGATGLIGDPRDTTERELSAQEGVAENTAKITKQVSTLLNTDVTIVNNADWLSKINFIDFLRDIGKHFTVNQLIKKEIIAKRLESESPISYTEFAYTLMQGYDFLHLFKTQNCTLQVGGSDQWGNIMSGVELVHKKEGKEVYALTAPLVIDNATGRKFGKSEGNAVWLDKELTSTYSFYQFWLNVDDADVVERLKIFTLLPLAEIEKLQKEVEENPKERNAQKTLAYEVTKFVHSEADAKAAMGVSAILFGNKNTAEITKDEIDILKVEAPTTYSKIGDNIVDTLLSSELATSKGDARKLINAGAVSINSQKITDEDYILADSDFANNIAILRKGKKHLSVLLQE